MAREVALLRHVVDYAGMFPPAALPFDAAVTRYAQYSQGGDAWMLGRFVCPAARLNELLNLQSPFSSRLPCRLSVLLASGAKGDVFFDALEGDLERAQQFQEQAPDYFTIEAFEMPMPPVRGRGSRSSMEPWTGQIVARIGRVWPEQLTVFVELPVTTLPPDEMAELLAGLQASAGSQRVRVAAKVRCGGTQATGVPAPDVLARFIYEAHQVGLPWKATAGLHQPFRRRMTGTADDAHGFINLFLAAVFVHADRLSEAEVETLLADDQPDHFVVESSQAAWKEIQVSKSEIDAVRTHFALSFGSCSFDEPLEGLREKGILDELVG